MTPADQAPYTLLATIFWTASLFLIGWLGEKLLHRWRNRR